MEAVALLLTYSISAALVESDGPWGILYRIRNFRLVKSFGLLDCFLCISFYVALVVSVSTNVYYGSDLLSTFAWSWGGSIIIDKSFTYLFTK